MTCLYLPNERDSLVACLDSRPMCFCTFPTRSKFNCFPLYSVFSLQFCTMEPDAPQAGSAILIPMNPRLRGFQDPGPNAFNENSDKIVLKSTQYIFF